MKEIILATGNAGKVKEFNEMANKYGISFVKIDMPEVDENGKSFEENSKIKAKAIFDISNGKPTMADDSGLVVDCLNGGPGIYTARYRNDLKTYKERGESLIREVDGKKGSRKARFVCVLTLITSKGEAIHFRGETYGNIAKECIGENGHGYDPIFLSDDLGKTFGMASMEEKDSVSHRSRAFEKLIEWLEKHDL